LSAIGLWPLVAGLWLLAAGLWVLVLVTGGCLLIVT